MRMVAIATLVICLIEIHADIQPQRDFDLQRFGGKWFRVGLADDSTSFLPFRDKLKISMGMLTPAPNGNVNLTMWGLSPSGCKSKTYIYEKTARPGQFLYYSTRHSRIKDITVVETNYSEYALVLKHKKMDREYTQVALYGRHPRVKPEWIQRFRDFAFLQGFPSESIITPSPPADNCPLPHGR